MRLITTEHHEKRKYCAKILIKKGYLAFFCCFAAIFSRIFSICFSFSLQAAK